MWKIPQQKGNVYGLFGFRDTGVPNIQYFLKVGIWLKTAFCEYDYTFAHISLIIYDNI